MRKIIFLALEITVLVGKFLIQQNLSVCIERKYPSILELQFLCQIMFPHISLQECDIVEYA